MTLNANSYSSVAEVLAMTRHMLDGAPTFDEATRPSLTEVEGFIDQISAELNDAIRACGLAIPIAAAGPKMSCDLWVRVRAAAMVELTQRGTGFDGSEDSRYKALWDLLNEDPFAWVEKRCQSWSDQGVTMTEAASGALTYTALNSHDNRSDPKNTTREQPIFRRRMFNG
jgi:hypothetical protein